ncbi:MAG: MAPEG family protein [Gammaproteobacteria bacterium]|nr:MAPEG family protein [Gammaproteobacteria bacterium]
MELLALVTVLIAMEYFFLAVMVAKSRSATGISAPSTIGDEKFERVFRVQQNTMEQLIIFFPALWIFGYYVQAEIGAALGVVFLIGRIVYARGYVQDSSKRGPGFVIGSLALLALMLGGLAGVVISLLQAA